MVDVSKFKLIERSENLAMYNYQEELLRRIEEGDGENAIRLSILLTLSPIGDYMEALKMLSSFSKEFSNIKLKIIESYLSLQWGNGIHTELLRKIVSVDLHENDELTSLIYYLIALQYKQDGNKKDAMKAIEVSVEKCSFHVNNLLMYAKYLDNNSAYYIQLAKNNLKSIQIEGLESYTDPDIFIGEHISGIYMSQDAFLNIG